MKADNRDVQRISNLAKGYDRNLCGKDFLICYGEEDNTRMLEVTFPRRDLTTSSASISLNAMSNRGYSIRKRSPGR